MTLLLDKDAVSAILTRAEALAAVADCFRLLGEGAASNITRRRSERDGTTLNVMWAHAPSLDTVAVKSYPVVRSDVSKASLILLTLFSHSTGECRAIMHGDMLGRRRTAAASALATRLAARPNSSRLVIFGTGYQASAQVEALAESMPSLRHVSVVGRDPDRTTGFAESIGRRYPALEITVNDAKRAVESADVVVTATGSPDPVFDGSWLRPGTHINAIGSNQPTKTELDRVAIERAATILVDDRSAAAAECGDLLVNGFPISRTTELGEIVVGKSTSRRHEGDITIFESQGLALQDLTCGIRVLQSARRSGAGIDFEFLGTSGPFG